MPSLGARNHNLAGPVVIGDIDSCSFWPVSGPLPCFAHQGRHASLGRIGGLFHEKSALGHDPETRLEIKGAGGGVSGESPSESPAVPAISKACARFLSTDRGKRGHARTVPAGSAMSG